jgi:UDP-N-acetyl-D-glucosamine dehydrogenase
LTSLLDKIAARNATVVVVGQGYVGLPLAMRASRVGFPVTGYEVVRARAESLSVGKSHVGDVTDEELTAALDRGYRPTADSDDLAGFDIAVISVPTPLTEGLPDLSYIESAAITVGQHLTGGSCVILESTTYPGTTEEFLAPIL